MDNTVWVAVIVSIAPTIAALGAWRSAGKANKAVDKVDAAVNARPPDAPTISDDVAAIKRQLFDLDQRVYILYSRFGELLDHITDPKKRHRT